MGIGDNITVNQFQFCLDHGSEVCWLYCFVDHREDNNARVSGLQQALGKGPAFDLNVRSCPWAVNLPPRRPVHARRDANRTFRSARRYVRTTLGQRQGRRADISASRIRRRTAKSALIGSRLSKDWKSRGHSSSAQASGDIGPCLLRYHTRPPHSFVQLCFFRYFLYFLHLIPEAYLLYRRPHRCPQCRMSSCGLRGVSVHIFSSLAYH